jgi:hypothetical protein
MLGRQFPCPSSRCAPYCDLRLVDVIKLGADKWIHSLIKWVTLGIELNNLGA